MQRFFILCDTFVICTNTGSLAAVTRWCHSQCRNLFRNWNRNQDQCLVPEPFYSRTARLNIATWLDSSSGVSWTTTIYLQLLFSWFLYTTKQQQWDFWRTYMKLLTHKEVQGFCCCSMWQDHPEGTKYFLYQLVPGKGLTDSVLNFRSESTDSTHLLPHFVLQSCFECRKKQKVNSFETQLASLLHPCFSFFYIDKFQPIKSVRGSFTTGSIKTAIQHLTWNSQWKKKQHTAPALPLSFPPLPLIAVPSLHSHKNHEWKQQLFTPDFGL